MTPTASRKKIWGHGVPLHNELQDMGRVVSFSARAPAKKRVLVHFELQRMHLMTTNSIFFTFL